MEKKSKILTPDDNHTWEFEDVLFCLSAPLKLTTNEIHSELFLH